ncbi:hypothetical protein PJP14_30070, partial [Mycobacterium kansasii]
PTIKKENHVVGLEEVRDPGTSLAKLEWLAATSVHQMMEAPVKSVSNKNEQAWGDGVPLAKPSE